MDSFCLKFECTTMARNDVDHGCLISLVGIVSTEPAEFVILRIASGEAGGNVD